LSDINNLEFSRQIKKKIFKYKISQKSV